VCMRACTHTHTACTHTHTHIRIHTHTHTGGLTDGPTPTVETFLKTLLDSSHGANCPEVILMAMQPPWEEIKAVIDSPWAMGQIVYLHGNPTSAADLEQRVGIRDVACCFILANTTASESGVEDMENIARAATVHARYGRPLLLMLLESRHAVFAIAAGIPERFIACMEDIEVSMLASSVRCQGLSTLAMNLVLPDLPLAPNEVHEVQARESWLIDYLSGANKGRTWTKSVKRDL